MTSCLQDRFFFLRVLLIKDAPSYPFKGTKKKKKKKNNNNNNNISKSNLVFYAQSTNTGFSRRKKKRRGRVSNLVFYAQKKETKKLIVILQTFLARHRSNIPGYPSTSL